MFICIFPFTCFSIHPFLCHLDLSRKNWTFWENPGTFEKQLGPTRILGEPFVKNPTGLVPLFARPSRCENFWEVSVSILEAIFLTHTSVTGQQNIKGQIKYKVIVSQVPLLLSQAAHRKWWKRGKRQAVPPTKFTYPKFSQMFQKNQETYSFWLLGNAKNPTDLKPYWSRAGLRHPDFYCWKYL